MYKAYQAIEQEGRHPWVCASNIIPNMENLKRNR